MDVYCSWAVKAAADFNLKNRLAGRTAKTLWAVGRNVLYLNFNLGVLALCLPPITGGHILFKFEINDIALLDFQNPIVARIDEHMMTDHAATAEKRD